MIIIENDIKLSENFTLKEFCHYSNGKYYIETTNGFYKFINSLQNFRIWYNRPIFINSCYRPEKYNKQIGGSKNSSHLYAMAIDFNYPFEYNSWTLERKEEFLNNVKLYWIKCCNNAGYKTQYNTYKDRFHIGFSLNRQDSFLDFR